MFTAVFIIAKVRRPPKSPQVDEWIKLWYTDTYTHTHTLEYYSAISE